MKYLLGIDVGTGSTKAVALNLRYSAIAVCQHDYPTFAPKPAYSEQDPELIWQAFKLCIQEVCTQVEAAPVSICLSAAMHSVICVDEYGKALSPMMTWADSRSMEVAKKLMESETGLELYQATGTPVHAMSPLCKIIWLKEHEPGLFKRTHKFISIKEYIWHKLFGEFKVDYSIASCTGLFDIIDLKWNGKALQLAGIGNDQLSEVVNTRYKKAADQSVLDFLPSHTEFVIGASDGCLANLGTEAGWPGLAALTIGTSAALRMNSPKPIYNLEAMTFNYLLDEKTYICGGPINNGGMALQWLLKNVFNKPGLTDPDYQSLFEGVEQTKPGSEGLIFLPYLTGERAPIWDSESCGNFFGLKVRHEQKHFARAVIEGICFALNDVLEAIEKYSGEIIQLNVSGGFIRSKTWMQILADVTGKRLVIIQEQDASAIGAVYLAAKSIGLSKDYPKIHHTASEWIVPNERHHLLYQSYFKLFKQLYADLKETMHRLHQLNH